MYNKIIALFLCLFFIFGATLLLVGCTDPVTECTEHKDENGDGICDSDECNEAVLPEENPHGKHFNDRGELYLFKGGKATFQFVIGNDIDDCYSDINDLAETLNSLSKSKIKVATLIDEAQEVEILFGTVDSRGEEYELNKYELGNRGFTVKQVGTKILVVGGGNTSIEKAVRYLKEEVFGIKKTTPTFTDKVMEKDLNYTFKQTEYSVTSVTIGDTPLASMAITYPSSDNTARVLATLLQDRIYVNTGLRCNTAIDDKYEGERILIKTLKNDGVGGGFYVNEENGSLIIECEYQNRFESILEDFFNACIFSKQGDVKIDTGYTYEPDLRTISYEDYGANGKDMQNDFFAIKAAHDDANENLLNVRAADDATYYITKASGDEEIIVKTNTYWGTAKFVIIDSDLAEDDEACLKNVFVISHDAPLQTYRPGGNDEISRLLMAINTAGGIRKDNFKSFDLGLGVPALVYIYNTEHKNYIRFGANSNKGKSQKELVYLNADGTVSEDTELLFDYDKITKIEIVFTNDRPITVSGGEFTTVANQLPCDKYIQRGIFINRSNAIIENVKHYVTGEGITSSPYRGFLNISHCSDVTVRDCVLTAHKVYTVHDSTVGTKAGTYDLSIDGSSKITILRVTQTNFFLEDGKTLSIDNGYWGIMASNFCKNIVYDDCTLSRFDAHMGVYNAKIINSRVSCISIIGGGKFEIINSKVYSTSRSAASLITLRNDYGSTWNGTFFIKDTELVVLENYASKSVALIRGTWDEDALNNPGWESEYEGGRHSFGYDCYMPSSVIVDNFKVSSSKVTTVALASGSIAMKHKNNTIDKYFVTEYYEVRNNLSGYIFEDPRDIYSRLEFVVG